MHVLREFLKNVWQQRIQNDYDHIILVIADEGDGKSTAMLQMVRWWQQFRGIPQTQKNILTRIAWDQDGFRDMLADAEQQSVIAGMDAARILNKSKAQKGDQKDLVEDLFDVRAKEHLFLMGYQEWGSVATTLQERRAKNALYIPERGRIEGYNREAMTERHETGEWPEPQLTCRFPALDGEPLWQEFRQRDLKRKRERMRRDDESEDDTGLSPTAVVDDIVEGGKVEDYVATNEFNGAVYVDADLIQFDYDLSVREAKRVKKAVAREVDVEAHTTGDSAGGDGGAHTA